jgi:hypothetical protein
MLKKYISERFAIAAVAYALSAFLVLHVLTMLGVLPFSMIWGGRLKTRADMLRLESFSLGFTVLLLVITAIRAGYIRIHIHPTVLRVAFGLMSLLFLLNTLGNATSQSRFEQLLFTPLTIILAICSMRLALYKPTEASGLPGNP